MTATPAAIASKDNASGQLQSGINASVTSIPLKSGNGANFPQPYNGTATSSGSSTTLNSTGILAAVGGSSSAMAGKLIWNKTDGSVAVILSVATNALICTRLLGGTDNTWDSSDVWCIDAFVATFAVVSATAYGVQSITQYEEALIIGRSTDTLTVATGGRGYNGTVANTFSADDYVYLFVTSPIIQRAIDVLAVVAVQQDADRTTLATAVTDITAQKTGSYHYVVTTGSANAYVAATPALAAYAAGNMIVFKANFTNTGAATINVNGLGAKDIKKNDGATALVANDIISGQIVILRYDGTNFQMLSPVGTPASVTVYEKYLFIATADSSAVGASSTAENNTDVNYSVLAVNWVAGDTIRLRCGGACNVNSGTLTVRVKLGTTEVGRIQSTGNPNAWTLDCDIVTRSVSGSGSVQTTTKGSFNGAATSLADSQADTVANDAPLTLQVSAQFSASDGGHTFKTTNFIVSRGSATLF